jgi:hypothetical protein
MSHVLDGSRRYISHRVTLAEALNGGKCGGDYSDACVILASVLSGISADLWPGKGIDRARFVETWVRYADPTLMPNRISLPLLVRRLKRKGDTSAVVAIKAAFPKAFAAGNTSRVLTGEMDLDEAKVQAVATGLDLKTSRPCISSGVL